MLWREGRCSSVRAAGRSCPPARSPRASPHPSPADHVAQGHGGQKQAQHQHQLEEEGGAGGTESARGRPGVPQEGVLGSKQPQGGAVSSFADPEEAAGPGSDAAWRGGGCRSRP